MAEVILNNINETTSGAYHNSGGRRRPFCTSFRPLKLWLRLSKIWRDGAVDRMCMRLLSHEAKLEYGSAGGLRVSGDLAGIDLSLVPPGETPIIYVSREKLIEERRGHRSWAGSLLSRVRQEERGVF